MNKKEKDFIARDYMHTQKRLDDFRLALKAELDHSLHDFVDDEQYGPLLMHAIEGGFTNIRAIFDLIEGIMLYTGRQQALDEIAKYMN